MTNGYDAYCLFQGLKLHFTTKNYDFIKYNGKSKTSQEAFMHRKDKYSYYRIARKYSIEELKYFFISNFLVNPNVWIGDLNSDEAIETYKKWQKVNQSISYTFEQDLITLFDLVDSPEKMLKVVDKQHPILLQCAMQERICLETLIILNVFMNFFPMWDRKIDDDILWSMFKMKCEKYLPFMNMDWKKLKNILKDKITCNV